MAEMTLAERLQQILGEGGNTSQVAGLYMLNNLQRVTLVRMRDDLEGMVKHINTILEAEEGITSRLNIPKDAELAKQEMVMAAVKANPSINPELVKQMFGG